MLFEPVVQIGLGGVIALRDELLRRTVCQQALDLRPKGIQLALARSPGPSFSPWAFLKRKASFVRCEIKSCSISAAIENASAMILLWMLWSSCQFPFTE